MILTSPECIPDAGGFVRIWMHEASRVYGDKLVDLKEQDVFAKMLLENIKKVFTVSNTASMHLLFIIYHWLIRMYIEKQNISQLPWTIYLLLNLWLNMLTDFCAYSNLIVETTCGSQVVLFNSCYQIYCTSIINCVQYYNNPYYIWVYCHFLAQFNWGKLHPRDTRTMNNFEGALFLLLYAHNQSFLSDYLYAVEFHWFGNHWPESGTG